MLLLPLSIDPLVNSSLYLSLLVVVILSDQKSLYTMVDPFIPAWMMGCFQAVLSTLVKRNFFELFRPLIGFILVGEVSSAQEVRPSLQNPVKGRYLNQVIYRYIDSLWWYSLSTVQNWETHTNKESTLGPNASKSVCKRTSFFVTI